MDNSKYLRDYEGHVHSNLEHYVPDPEILNGKRLIYGSQWYNSATGKFTLKIAEDRGDHIPNVPCFEISAWENLTEEEKMSRFNLGDYSGSIVDYPGAVWVEGIENLNLKIKEIADLIVKLETKIAEREAEKQRQIDADKAKEKQEFFESALKSTIEYGKHLLSKPGKKRNKAIESINNFLTNYDPKNINLSEYTGVDLNEVHFIAVTELKKLI